MVSPGGIGAFYEVTLISPTEKRAGNGRTCTTDHREFGDTRLSDLIMQRKTPPDKGGAVSIGFPRTPAAIRTVAQSVRARTPSEGPLAVPALALGLGGIAQRVHANTSLELTTRPRREG